MRFEDYREVGGFLLPHRYWNVRRPERVGVVERLETNALLDGSRFVFPAGIR
jgi:hypothetical protein